MGLLSSKRPADLGVRDGRLKPPPASPKAVSIQASNGYHRIAPLTYRASRGSALAALKAIVENTPRTRIMEVRPDYLYAEYTSKLMGYVDDVEFYLPLDGKIIHVRSASRLGRSDFGANRKRIENIRARMS